MRDVRRFGLVLLVSAFSLLALLAPGCSSDSTTPSGEGEGEGEGGISGCTTDDTCGPTQFCLLSAGGSSGLCASGCRLQPDNCTTPTGSHCDGTIHRCVVPPCASDADCAADSYCNDPGVSGACTVGCRLDPIDACGADKHCDTTSHQCVANPLFDCTAAGATCDDPTKPHCNVATKQCVACLQTSDCKDDELCVATVCEKACPDGCPEATVCNKNTRQCDDIDCTAPDTTCPADWVCCPSTTRCTPGECRASACCAGSQPCIDEGNQWCHGAHAANYYCQDDNSCGEKTDCLNDAGCPADSYCDTTRDPHACMLGCRTADPQACSAEPGKVCEEDTRFCNYPRCPNGQLDCTCTQAYQAICSDRTHRCEPVAEQGGCCADDYCDTANGQFCSPETHTCTVPTCELGDIQCSLAPMPDGTWCDEAQNPPVCVSGCQEGQAALQCPAHQPCNALHECGCAGDVDCDDGLKCLADKSCGTPPCQGPADCPAGSFCNAQLACEVGCPADALEPNDDRDHPHLLPAESAQFADLTICNNEEDWYAVHLGIGDALTAALTFDHTRLSLITEIYAPGVAAALVGSTNGLDDDAATATLEAARVVFPGDYLIRVVPVHPVVASGFYGMELTVTIGQHCLPDALEGPGGNDTQATAATVQPQIYDALTLCPGDADWYVLQLQANDVVTAQASCDGEDRLKLELLDGGAGEVTFAESGCWNQIHQQVAAAGVYYLRVSHSEGAELAEVVYQLMVAVEHHAGPCAADPYEQNNDVATAWPLAGLVAGAAGNTINGGKICGWDDDWFQIPAICPYDSLTAHIDFANADGDLDLELYGQNTVTQQAELVGSSHGETDSEEITVLNQASGLTWVRVFGSIEVVGNGASYGLHLNFTCPNCQDDRFDAAPGNNTKDQAAHLVLAQHEQNLKYCRRDVDWYYVDLPAGAHLRAQLCFFQLSCDLELDVYDSAMNLLNPWGIDAPGHTSTDNECVLEPDGLAAGRYYLKVYPTEAAMTSCSYSLKADDVPGSACPAPGDRNCPIP